jgi:predicted amidohydrolase
MPLIRIAGCQMEPAFADIPANLEKVASLTRKAADAGARLVVFPECALSGYCFDSIEQALPASQPVPGPATELLAGLCRELSLYIVVGMLECADGRVYNAAVLIGPAGVVGTYRKVHLPWLGVDRFTEPGDRGFGVFELSDPALDAGGAAGPPLPWLRVGMNICYDGSFPEGSRVMALRGADLIVLPTNWPPGAEITAEHVVNARAGENNVYFAAINRVGDEGGFHFIGCSKIADHFGRTMVYAEHDRPELLIADIDPALARNKHIVRVPRLHEIDRFRDRRPELYGEVVAPVAGAARRGPGGGGCCG